MIKIILPSSDVIEAINKAKEDHLFVTGFFIKYNVKFNESSIEIEPKEGFEYNLRDVFHLGWAAREYM
ncbi:hypothetical protein [Sphingobacterium siyangense]|uniref:Uncharacterized protein n=1 Tax=Sphingobacterium siyangense TaxID=459529 RepID=A0A562MRK6_9SPHI|nr:hypothetical protein [Sphingobacterium siyangense]TWI22211.1 hypothetical protein IQ31_01616 [Sphingobacterium siyangense]